jgi:hypothetical protein
MHVRLAGSADTAGEDIMTPDQFKTWLGIGAALLAAGIWLGSLQQRVAQLERTQTYLHGAIHVPEGQ